jgi:ADP-ribose pyrophosphatase YjhB (NUDIX family)
MMAQPQMLECREDKYEGVVVEELELRQIESESEFEQRLGCSLDSWRRNLKRGVWMKVPIERSELIPVATKKFGFTFHHAEPSYVMLTTWLCEGPSSLPPNASHQVGVGAFVLDGRGRILVVKERHGPLMGLDVWKMPTGLLEVGEDLSCAAEREVKEETGLSCRFDRVLAMRHSHGFSFGKSDMFFIAQLTPLDEDPEGALVHQQSELEGCKWMDFDEYLQQEHLAGSPLHSAINNVLKSHRDGALEPAEIVGEKHYSRIGGRESMLYYSRPYRLPGKI